MTELYGIACVIAAMLCAPVAYPAWERSGLRRDLRKLALKAWRLRGCEADLNDSVRRRPGAPRAAHLEPARERVAAPRAPRMHLTDEEVFSRFADIVTEETVPRPKTSTEGDL